MMIGGTWSLRPSVWAWAAAGAVAGCLMAAGELQAYAVETTAPLSITVPLWSQGQAAVFFRNEAGQWTPADFSVDDGRVIIRLDVRRVPAGSTMLVINPPPDLKLDDDHPPAFAELRLDRQVLRRMGPHGLENQLVSRAPRRLEALVTDRENRVDPDSVRVLLDGVALPPSRLKIQRSGSRRAWHIAADLPPADYGDHTIRVEAADDSPQRNRALRELSFSRVNFNNVALARLGGEITVDSYFPGYPSLACLNDGFVDLPGAPCGNDVTWASAETKEPHWAEVQWPKKQSVSAVKITWAFASHDYKTSQQFELQVPAENGRWRTVARWSAEGREDTKDTTVRFAPVLTDRLRIYQDAGQGPTDRPDLLWLAEIEVLKSR